MVRRENQPENIEDVIICGNTDRPKVKWANAGEINWRDNTRMVAEALGHARNI